MQEKGWTHKLGDRNGVSSGFECDNGDGHTIWETNVELAVGLHCEKRDGRTFLETKRNWSEQRIQMDIRTSWDSKWWILMR